MLERVTFRLQNVKSNAPYDLAKAEQRHLVDKASAVELAASGDEAMPEREREKKRPLITYLP